MARSEELTEDFFTSVETPLAVLSPDGRVTRANNALRRAVRTPDVLEGAPFVSNLRAGIARGSRVRSRRSAREPA